MEATDIEDLGLLNKLPNFGALEMVKLVAIGSGKVGAQAPVVACDDYTAPASGLFFVDAILDPHARFGADVPKRLSILVLANAANVDDGIRRQDVLQDARPSQP